MRFHLVAILTALALATPTKAEPLQCPRQPGTIGGPYVPDPEAAKAIFLVVEKALGGSGTHRNRPLGVSDEGSSWTVSHMPPPRPPGTRTFGGGMLTVEIDKCTGAVLKAYYAR